MSRDFQSVAVIRNMNSVMKLEGDLITEVIHGPCTNAIAIEFFDSVGDGHGLGYSNVCCAPRKKRRSNKSKITTLNPISKMVVTGDTPSMRCAVRAAMPNQIHRRLNRSIDGDTLHAIHAHHGTSSTTGTTRHDYHRRLRHHVIS